MALEGSIGIAPTLNSVLRVREPAAASGDLLASFRRVPGVGTVTLPDPQAQTGTAVLLDGSKAFPLFAERGSITIPLTAMLAGHKVIQALKSMRGTTRVVSVRMSVPINVFGNYDDAITNVGRVCTVPAAKRAELTGVLEPGMEFWLEIDAEDAAGKGVSVDVSSNANRVTFGEAPPTGALAVGNIIRVASANYTIETVVSTTVVDVAEDFAADVTDEDFEIYAKYSIVELSEQTAASGAGENLVESFVVDPAPPVNLAAAADLLQLARPRLRWPDFSATVLGVSDGTVEAQSVVSGQITLLPTAAIGNVETAIPEPSDTLIHLPT